MASRTSPPRFLTTEDTCWISLFLQDKEPEDGGRLEDGPGCCASPPQGRIHLR